VLQRLVDDTDDRGAEVVAVDLRLARAAERRFGFAVLAGGDQRRDPHVRAEREQRQQESSSQLVAGKVLARGDRRELVREGGQVVDLPEHVEQVDHPPAADDLPLECLKRRRLALFAQPRDANPTRLPCGS